MSARKQRWDLSTETAMNNFQAHIGNMRLAGKRPVVELVPEKRSLDQNAMIHALYKQISEQKQDETFRGIRQECKLHFGVPILRRDDEQFRQFYDGSLKPLAYEFKLESMQFVPVTSLMNKTQCTEYIDEIIRVYSMQGVPLVHPSEVWQ